MNEAKVIDWDEYVKMRSTALPVKSDKVTANPRRTTKAIKSVSEFDQDWYEAQGNKGGQYPKKAVKGGSLAIGDKGAFKYDRCYHSHKPLAIGDYTIYGGSCISPSVHDADIYVGFERSMNPSPKGYPWNPGFSFCFPIVDANVPDSLDETMKLLDFLEENLKAGKKIHIGCIGGHGRTGTILAALVAKMTGNLNAIEYVRTNYCSKAVETTTQIDWLNKNFGITKVKPSKQHAAYSGAYGQGSFGFMGTTGKGVSKSYGDIGQSSHKGGGLTFIETVKPVRVKGNIFGC